MMDFAAALEFVRTHGVVLVAAKGPVPTLTHAIVGEAIRGSWWGHPQGKHIFAVLQQVSEHDDILACRLIGDKITLVHRRLWPALAAVAAGIAPSRLCRVTQVHTASGRHANHETPFPDWLPPEDASEARTMSRDEALAALGPAAGAMARSM